MNPSPSDFKEMREVIRAMAVLGREISSTPEQVRKWKELPPGTVYLLNSKNGFYEGVSVGKSVWVKFAHKNRNHFLFLATSYRGRAITAAFDLVAAANKIENTPVTPTVPEIDLYTFLMETFKNEGLLCFRHCWACFRPTKKHCSGCKVIHYCSTECQTKDWPAHSLHCKVYQNYENTCNTCNGFGCTC